MNNPILNLIHAHGSARKYKTDPVPTSVIETIIAAAQRASTSSNLQTYSVVAVLDEITRHRISAMCGDQEHIKQAPVFLAWCADLARLERVCQLRGYTQVVDYLESFLVAVVDTSIAAQNAALAAESLGLGICYIGSIRNNPPAMIELLDLPPLVFPLIGMTVGWPEKTHGIRPRLPLRAVLHWEHYDRSGEDLALMEYDRAMIATGIYTDRQEAIPGKPEIVEDYGWLEHTARRASQVHRPELRAVLEKQGFGLK